MASDAKRRYVSPLRDAAAAATRARILESARVTFEQRGWAASTLAAVAASAGASPKTIQAQFGTKARLLAAVVDHSVRRDRNGEPAPRRVGAGAIRAAPDAPGALRLHAAMTTEINSRAAGLAGVVEAAAGDPDVAALWVRMRESMRVGVDWAAEVIFAKPGRRADLTLEDLRTVVQIAMAWGTYRTLAFERGLPPEAIRDWIEELYRRMLLPPGELSA